MHHYAIFLFFALFPARDNASRTFFEFVREIVASKDFGLSRILHYEVLVKPIHDARNQSEISDGKSIDNYISQLTKLFKYDWSQSLTLFSSIFLRIVATNSRV